MHYLNNRSVSVYIYKKYGLKDIIYFKLKHNYIK